MSKTIFSLEKIEKNQSFRHGDADRHVVFFLLLPGPALLDEDVALPEQREGMNDGVFLGGVALLPLLAGGRLEPAGQLGEPGRVVMGVHALLRTAGVALFVPSVENGRVLLVEAHDLNPIHFSSFERSPIAITASSMPLTARAETPISWLDEVWKKLRYNFLRF